MSPRTSLIIAAAGAALVLAMPAAADTWGADRNEAIVRVSPDLADRAEAARQVDLARILDVASDPRPRRGRDDDLAPSRSATTVSGSTRPASRTSGRDLMGRDLDWQQIGTGFAGGVMLDRAAAGALRRRSHRLSATIR